MNSKSPTPYKLQTRWKITGTLTMRSPMHIGNGETVRHPLLTNPATGKSNEVAEIERDYCGNPIIPGSALKGVLRSWADRHYSAHTTAIARIFGDLDSGTKHAKAGFAEFDHASLITPSPDQLAQFERYLPHWRSGQQTGILSHVCIDRHNGTADAQKLFFEEFIPESTSFRVEIFAERLTDADIQLLLAVLEHGSAHDTDPLQFGANGADGWGRVRWSFGRVERADPTGVQFDANSMSFHQTWSSVNLTALPTPTTSSDVRTIPVELQCRGAFLVNDKSRTHRAENDGLPHFTPLRRAGGGVWLPASSFRGVLRQRAEFILRSLDPTASGNPNKPLQANGAIERIFGMTGRASRLTIEEFTEIDSSSVRCQDFVAIDRFTGGAAEGAKFDAEYADRPMVTSRLHLDPQDLSQADLAIFAAALRDVMRGDLSFGFGGSKGYGEFHGAWDAASEAWAKDVLKHLPAATPATTQEIALPVASPAKLKTIEGKLIYQQVQGKPVRRIIYRNKNKEWTTQAPTPFDASLLPASLRNNTSPEIDIDFEWESPNKPSRIRERGQHIATTAKHALTAAQSQGKFAHAYYFLRQEERKSDWPHDFADREPVGHDRYVEGYFSGTIRVRLTTKTPLLICNDATRRERTPPGHFEYDMRVDADDQPVLQPSSVRGMLRAAYEAITNSRFGVFAGHDDRLGLRMTTNEGLGLAPCRIDNGQIHLMPGTSRVTSQKPGGPMYAAWLPSYPASLQLAGSNTESTHRQRVCCWIELWQRTPWKWADRNRTQGEFLHDKKFSYWKVLAITPHGESLTEPAATPPQAMEDGKNHHTSLGQPLRFVASGYVCRTGFNFDRKHDERVFFDLSTAPAAPLPLTDNHRTVWANLIRNYRANQDLINGMPRPGALQRAGWSRHMVGDNDLELTEGSLAYARLNPMGGISELFPVMIARKLYQHSPFDRLPELLRPAPDRSRLSPADRVFGWVSQAGPSEENPAYRSQLRVGVVECETENSITPLDPPLVLPILAQPKPAQGRFYLGNQQGRTQPQGGTKEQRGYTSANRIRGPKVYPHHSQFLLNRLRNPPHPPSNQNRSITGCVKERTEFVFDLHLLNLSRTELAALVWLLSLPESHYLRLGLGKPLGFGSIRMIIDSSGTCVADGKEWIAKLGDWDAKPQGIALLPLLTEYETVMSAVNPSLLPSFLQIAKGFGDVDVKYPPNPKDPNGVGNHFEWFVANEKRPNGAVSLPDPNDGEPLLATNPDNA